MGDLGKDDPRRGNSVLSFFLVYMQILPLRTSHFSWGWLTRHFSRTYPKIFDQPFLPSASVSKNQKRHGVLQRAGTVAQDRVRGGGICVEGILARRCCSRQGVSAYNQEKLHVLLSSHKEKKRLSRKKREQKCLWKESRAAARDKSC